MIIKKRLINSLINKFLSPIFDNRLFFCIVFISILVIPISYSIIIKARILHFIISALGQAIITAYFLSFLILLIPNVKYRKAFNVVLTIPFVAWMLIEMGCLLMTGNIITFDTAIVIIETNLSEVQGFFSHFLTLRSCLLLLLIILTSVILIIFCLYVFRVSKQSFWAKLLLSFLTLCGLGFGVNEYITIVRKELIQYLNKHKIKKALFKF